VEGAGGARAPTANADSAHAPPGVFLLTCVVERVAQAAAPALLHAELEVFLWVIVIGD